MTGETLLGWFLRDYDMNKANKQKTACIRKQT